MLHQVNLGMIFQGLQMRNYFGWHLQTRCQTFFNLRRQPVRVAQAMPCGKSRFRLRWPTA